MKSNQNRGVTLIEILIYLALYGMLMTGAITSVYAIIGTSARNQTKALVQEEGNYLIGKVDWALSGTKTVHEPSVSGNRLSMTKYNPSVGDPLAFSLTGGALYFRRGGGVAVQINNTNVTITCEPAGCFEHQSASGDGINPESIRATFTVNSLTPEGQLYSQEFSTVKYLRK